MVVLYKCNCCNQFDLNFCCCSMLVYASLEQLQHALVQITCIQNNSHKQMNIWTVLNLNNTWVDTNIITYIINPYLYPHPQAQAYAPQAHPKGITKKYVQIRRWSANLEWQALCLDNIVIMFWCAEILWDIFRWVDSQKDKKTERQTYTLLRCPIDVFQNTILKLAI